MSHSLMLPDELVDRLQRAAVERGTSVEQLVAEALSALGTEPAQRAPNRDATEDEDVLVSCTRALLDGDEPPIDGDWDQLQEALSRSEAPYPSVEEAMSSLRQRAWTKDE